MFYLVLQIFTVDSSNCLPLASKKLLLCLENPCTHQFLILDMGLVRPARSTFNSRWGIVSNNLFGIIPIFTTIFLCAVFILFVVKLFPIPFDQFFSLLVQLDMVCILLSGYLHNRLQSCCFVSLFLPCYPPHIDSSLESILQKSSQYFWNGLPGWILFSPFLFIQSLVLASTYLWKPICPFWLSFPTFLTWALFLAVYICMYRPFHVFPSRHQSLLWRLHTMLLCLLW